MVNYKLLAFIVIEIRDVFSTSQNIASQNIAIILNVNWAFSEFLKWTEIYKINDSIKSFN